MKKRSIVLACGGSGGHTNPAISLYEELTIYDPDLVVNFFSDRRGQVYLEELDNVNIKGLLHHLHLELILIRNYFFYFTSQ